MLGGDCTVELGTVAGALRGEDSIGLIYVDLDTDLNPPEASDGALDWTVLHIYWPCLGRPRNRIRWAEFCTSAVAGLVVTARLIPVRTQQWVCMWRKSNSFSTEFDTYLHRGRSDRQPSASASLERGERSGWEGARTRAPKQPRATAAPQIISLLQKKLSFLRSLEKGTSTRMQLA